MRPGVRGISLADTAGKKFNAVELPRHALESLRSSRTGLAGTQDSETAGVGNRPAPGHARADRALTGR